MMRLIDTKRRGTQRRWAVWLDTTKTLPDGSPDPDWVAAAEFPADPPAGVGATAYRDDIFARVKVFARAALAERQAAQAVAASGLAIEGQEFV
jgi:hypothetical protein